MKHLLNDIRGCRVCEQYLEAGCRPILEAHKKSRILIIGQAPGIKVHESGVPWQDKSGDNLRTWAAISREEFYNPKLIGIVPMGFCYPGKGKSGDLPPRKECAPLWHNSLLEQMNNVGLTLLIGQYAQKYYLGKNAKSNLTETVKNFQNYLPTYFPLPHPSPRNFIWMAKNPWFERDVLPELAKSIRGILGKKE